MSLYRYSIGSMIFTSSSKLIFMSGTISPSLSYAVRETARIVCVDHQNSSPVVLSLFVSGNSLLSKSITSKPNCTYTISRTQETLHSFWPFEFSFFSCHFEMVYPFPDHSYLRKDRLLTVCFSAKIERKNLCMPLLVAGFLLVVVAWGFVA